MIRKIISKDRENKKKKRNQFLAGGFLIIVMLFSVIGYSFMGGNKNSVQKANYNGIEFTKESNFWIAEIGNAIFYFKYLPTEVEKTEDNLNVINNYYDKPLYIYSENSDAESEIYRNLFYYNQIVQRIQKACFESENCSGDLPVKNCTDNFIIIKKSENSSIRQEENCVFIEGENLVKLTDAVLYKIIGVQ